MKLYTEEQLVNTVQAVVYYYENYTQDIAKEMIKKHLINLVPVELPDNNISKSDVYDLDEAEQMYNQAIRQWGKRQNKNSDVNMNTETDVSEAEMDKYNSMEEESEMDNYKEIENKTNGGNK